jgi:hypothetical protein
MIPRRRRRGWGNSDRDLNLAILAGSALGIVLGLVTANVGWIAGRLVDLSQVLAR